MIAILISWLLILFISISFGGILLNLQKFFCKDDEFEVYSTVDLTLLGLCFLLIPLSVVSLFFPCNGYVLLGIVLISGMFWFFDTSCLFSYLQKLKSSFSRLSKLELFLLFLLFISFLLLAIWNPNSEYDPRYYHYQNIQMMEEYPVIPGLANLEDRFGFNSNYFLLSAVFSLSSFFGTSIYGLQSFVFVLVAVWLLKEVFLSNFETKSLLAFLFFVPLYYIFSDQISDTSTDILPSVMVYYLVVRYFQNPSFSKQPVLLFVFVPISIVTFKLSYAIFALIVVLVFWMLLKQKGYKKTAFVVSISFLLVVFWLIRNVIISGYLIYPLHEIDLFAFDWKVPKEVAVIERNFINSAGKYFLNLYSNHIPYPHFSLENWRFNFIAVTGMLITLCGFSIFTFLAMVVVDKWKKYRMLSGETLIVVVLLILCFSYWLISAPAFRFIAGIVCGILFITAIYISQLVNNRKLSIPQGLKFSIVGAIVVLIFLSKGVFWNYKALPFYRKSLEFNPPHTLAVRPLRHLQDIESYSPAWRGYQEYYMGDVLIYMKSYKVPNEYILLDKIPSVVSLNMESRRVDHGRILDINSVENRGSTIQDGFRAKQNSDLYIKELLH